MVTVNKNSGMTWTEALLAVIGVDPNLVTEMTVSNSVAGYTLTDVSLKLTMTPQTMEKVQQLMMGYQYDDGEYVATASSFRD